MNREARIIATDFAAYILAIEKKELDILRKINLDVPFEEIEKEYMQIINDLQNTARLWERSQS